MKNLVEYKRKSVIVLGYWDKFFEKLTEKLPLEQELGVYEFRPFCIDRFELNFLEFYIRKALQIPDNILYKRLFNLNVTVEPAGYHGSAAGKSIYKLKLELHGIRHAVNSSVRDYDVSDHSQEYFDFINEHGQVYYDKLNELANSGIFPITVED